jgi:LacI family transcriptional regulator, purine nucleotide synthesis repressor
MKAIIQDIAKLAGVSPGTVSNALNNKKGVGKSTKEKILKIAEELSYDKNTGRQEVKVINFIIFKKHGFVVSDTPFFSKLIEGTERECRAQGFEMRISHVICDEHSYEEIQEIVKQNQIAGVLLLATEMDETDLKIFSNLNVPIVILDSYFKNMDFDYVLMNNTNGAYKAVKYLIENGHTEIGCLGSSKLINNFRYRYEGFKNAIMEADLNVNKDYELFLEPTLEGAYRDMKEILNKSKLKFPTAYFAFNDIIAFGAMRAMKENGISIPEQVSLIGFDDAPFCEISSPRLTTIRMDIQYIGKTAVKRLVEKISEQDNQNLKIEINTELIERESVKKQ